MPRRLALTGTPGTGKTVVARELARRGWGLLDVAQFAKDEGYVLGEDPARPGTFVLDEDAVAERFDADDWPEEPVVVEGHIAHLLPHEAVLVLRCDPVVLMERLRARGWPESKVRENVEAEALSVVAEECEGERVIELDTTRAEPAAIADAVEAAFLRGPFPPRRRIGWDVGKLPWV
ncbi:MAG TPA: adenylate kinase family protein [Candidatus Thermoplasmatota archaeon]|nr:adenylate kinase family protein [Candidatus Thermoplasmatota archaeon]